ncbi:MULTISPECIES: helix-turn-helix domain-containing protein [Streptomyces]|uniref:XRE family transcriptional regulator n=1 Tax=Streptomyces alboflavus TaxID=67267 RepID=A0A1Z1W7L3_9ACTN|nr:helix-turn-helix transcriptional regulator [Streptomyces alboflavus]ARX82379.1 XRE family transcriptional regulator [Streptomyces alboflavus]
MDSDNLLGQFLRARRARVGPADVGMPGGLRRRVPGLRREEVAMLAGLSTDYYVRLEQGRERNPSAQVLEALAGALLLEGDAVVHLHRLAGTGAGGRRAGRGRKVGAGLARMLDSWAGTPAVVLDHCLRVLAHNPLGGALFAGHTYSGDLVRFVFLDPGAPDFYPDWDRVAVNTVAALREGAGADLNDPELTALVGELSLKSAAFRELWARHDIRRKTRDTKRFHHPVVGDLTLTYESFTVNSEPGRQLVVYQAEPGSPSAHALALLGSLTVPEPAERSGGGAAGDLPRRGLAAEN